MKRLLITGATGNVGMEVIRALHQEGCSLELTAGVRDIHKDYSMLTSLGCRITRFDFTAVDSYRQALADCDILFLLRPPQISQVKRYFQPLVEMAKASGVKHIVFLSVQGAENSRLIPHHKIEALVRKSGIPYTFLRPAYFMQNFTTTLRKDIINHHHIFLPAGNTLFTLIDVRDIGCAAARVLQNTELHLNKAYDLTSNEKLNFQQMAEKISSITGISIQYQSPGPFRFFLVKRKEGQPVMLILVMIMLHYLPRFQKQPPLSDAVYKLTGTQPVGFDQFLADNKAVLV